MDAETRKEVSAFITYKDMAETQDALRRDLTARIDGVDEKVDDLRDLVLPLIESSKQTAENTRQIASSIEKFTDAQRKTNEEVGNALHAHDKRLDVVQKVTEAYSEQKKSNTAVIVAIISALTAVVTAIITIAPNIF